eukprot:COSAG02_NODE_6768_length_3370_cov_5.094161_2_plen_72_part_00
MMFDPGASYLDQAAVPGLGLAAVPGQPSDRETYSDMIIRNLGDIAQAQKRQALSLMTQSEWATSMQAKVQQ